MWALWVRCSLPVDSADISMPEVDQTCFGTCKILGHFWQTSMHCPIHARSGPHLFWNVWAICVFSILLFTFVSHAGCLLWKWTSSAISQCPDLFWYFASRRSAVNGQNLCLGMWSLWFFIYVDLFWLTCTGQVCCTCARCGPHPMVQSDLGNNHLIILVFTDIHSNTLSVTLFSQIPTNRWLQG